MTKQTHALLQKEWIKLRRGIWIILLLLTYAAVDSLLNLKNIDRIHGSFGLWYTLISKEPLFFSTFMLLPAYGVVLGFLQAWPETQGKRLRLMFHMPMDSMRILSVILATGLSLLIVANIMSHAILTGIMAIFHLPAEVIKPVLYTMLPWSLLSVATYLTTIAFFGSKGLPLKLLVLACGYAAYNMLGKNVGYAKFSSSIWFYALLTFCFLALVYFVFMRYFGNPTDKPLFSLARGFALLLAVLGLSIILPDLYWRVAMPEITRQNVFYSPVLGQFVQYENSRSRHMGPPGSRGSVYSLENSKSIDKQQYAQALPFLYAEDLMKWNMFPKTIAGQQITGRQARFGWRYMNFNPRSDWNCPPPMLHMLLESQPHGAKLTSPEDVFRVRHDGNGVEFIRPVDGTVDEDKSERFTQALKEEGFAFPMLALGGNPDLRKKYDVGYFLVDSGNTLFQMKMVQGNPYCVNSGQTVPGKVRGVIVSEHRRREYYGFVVTDDSMYAILTKGMKLQRLPVKNFNADTVTVAMFSDLVSKSIVTRDPANWQKGSYALAMNPDYEIVKTFIQPRVEEDLQAIISRQYLESFIFPLHFEQRRPGSSYIHFYPQPAGQTWVAIASGLLSLALLAFMRKKNGTSLRMWDCGLVLVFGPIALLVITAAEWNKPIKILQKS